MPNSVSIGFDTAMNTGSFKTIQMIPHNNLYVSVKLTSLYSGLRLILLVYPNPNPQ